MNNKRKTETKGTKLSDKELSDITQQKAGVIGTRIISPSDEETAA
jgi:hypothetical protein